MWYRISISLSRSKVLRLRLRQLRVDELHWYAQHTTRLLDLLQTMNGHLYRAHIIYRVSPCPAPGSSGSHCNKWIDDQHKSGRFDLRSVPDVLFPYPLPMCYYIVSNPVWWKAMTNIHTKLIKIKWWSLLELRMMPKHATEWVKGTVSFTLFILDKKSDHIFSYSQCIAKN